MPVDTRKATEAPGGRLVDLSRRPTEPDAADAGSCSVATEAGGKSGLVVPEQRPQVEVPGSRGVPADDDVRTSIAVHVTH